MSSHRPPSPGHLSWAAAAVGRELAATPVPNPHGANLVWRLDASDGRAFFLKRPAKQRAFVQELAAYRDWLHAIPADNGASVPRLLCADRREQLLLITALDGAPDPVFGSEAHHGAGRFLRWLHDSGEPEPDALPVAEALNARMDSWLRHLGPKLTPRQVDGARSLLDAGRAFSDESRVRCHRDYHPRNWISLNGPATQPLGVIDFEHARGDHWLFDIVRLWAGEWHEKPDLEAAFWEGYGSVRDDVVERQLTAVGAIHAVATIAWASAHSDKRFEHEGRALLARLL